jgi:excisionase family DNA binding protein
VTRGTSPEERARGAAEARTELERLPIEPISVRIATAVKLTGIGRSTIYELISSGQIETVKIGRSTFIPYRCLKRLIDG